MTSRSSFDADPSRSPNRGTQSRTPEVGLSPLDQEALLAKVTRRLFGEGREIKLGRFEVIERIGAGGMGVVYLGRDPDLDRRVALKLLHPRHARREQLATAERRMRREARLMARLEHPNVVHIHEVGVHEGRLFLAMEYVDGTDLACWLATERRSWTEIVAVFCQAGEGLHAAHQAGMIHRDIKPENLLIDASGIVKVTDFGLAAVSFEEQALTEDSSTDEGSTLSTKPGGFAGTPLYMSPEQFSGLELDARSDQFSFCVALREALLGERPFAGRDAHGLSVAVSEGRLRPRPTDHGIPTWLLDVVERGLAPDASQRWPSMRELLAALRDDPSVRRRKRARMAAVVVLVGSLAGAGGSLLAAGGAPKLAVDSCADVERELDGVWDESREQAVRAALRGADSVHASDTAVRVVARLDAYAKAWADAATTTCRRRDVLLAEVGAEASARCLQRQRSELRELVSLLSDRDRVAAHPDKVLEAVERLPPSGRCLAIDYLLDSSPIPADPERADEVEAVREELAKQRSLLALGDVAGALSDARELERDAIELDFRPLLGEVRLALARAKFENDDVDTLAVLEQAFLDAEASGHEALVREAGIFRINVMLRRDSVTEALLAWARLIEAKLTRAGAPLEWADYQCAMMNVQNAAGEHAAALERGRECLRLRIETLGDSDPLIGRTYEYLAYTELILGRYEQGIADAKRAIEIAGAHRRPSHTDATGPRITLAQLYQITSRYEDARDLMAATVPLVELEVGPENSRLADVLMVQAGVLVALREFGEAGAMIERALVIHERTLGPEHIRVAADLAVLAGIHEGNGDLDAARDAYARAIEIAAASLGHGFEQASFCDHLGSLELRAGNLERAEELLRTALKLATDTLGPESPNLGFFHADLADVLLARGRAAEAVAEYSRSLELAEAELDDHDEGLAALLVDLATAEREAGMQARAREHAERAAKIANQHGDDELALEARELLAGLE